MNETKFRGWLADIQFHRVPISWRLICDISIGTQCFRPVCLEFLFWIRIQVVQYVIQILTSLFVTDKASCPTLYRTSPVRTSLFFIVSSCSFLFLEALVQIRIEILGWIRIHKEQMQIGNSGLMYGYLPTWYLLPAPGIFSHNLNCD
jgi:hypothetical protein